MSDINNPWEFKINKNIDYSKVTLEAIPVPDLMSKKIHNAVTEITRKVIEAEDDMVLLALSNQQLRIFKEKIEFILETREDG